MPVHIGKITSEVIPEPEAPTAPQSGSDLSWQEVDKLRVMAARMVRDQSRTRAEGFDD